MVQIHTFTNDFFKLLKNEFGSNIWFAGLQGSYARGEADENSDIDIVVILNECRASDIEKYNTLLDCVSERKLMCGFISGKDELFHWNVSELFQFYYDTKPVIGSLDALLSLINVQAVEQSIKAGACSIYHACVHNMLYEKNGDILKSLYKSAVFVLQAVCFQQNGKYISYKKDLMNMLQKEDKRILNTYIALKKGAQVHFKEMSEMLFCWSKHLINKEYINENSSSGIQRKR